MQPARHPSGGSTRSLDWERLIASTTPAPSDVHDHPLDPIFHPRSVAVVGASSREQPGGWRGGSFLGALLEAGYEREHGLYPVNPKTDEVSGLRCYPSVLDCPDPVDHVICQIPALAAPRLVDQCTEKGVRSIHFFTAGFSETGDEKMAAVEREMVAKARAAGLRIIGPNCLGLYVPGVGLAFMGGFPGQPGNVFLLSQSGANAGAIVQGLAARGVRFSKAVSYGNGADLRAHDFLDYAASDPQTEVVTAYIEGVRDGRRFLDALRRCAAVKPTILLKGGLTAAGARAANSHTGSLAGSSEVFEALCRQTGAVRAQTMEELHDLVIATTTGLRRVRGPGVALIAGGGGYSVLSADRIALTGLELPPLPKETQRVLREFIPVAGTSVRNPIDAHLGRHTRDAGGVRRAHALVADADPVDVVFSTVGGWDGSDDGDDGPQPDGDSPRARAERARRSADELAELQGDAGVPVVAIQRSRGEAGREESDAFRERAYERGLSVFSTVERAAAAVARLLEWRKRREGMGALF